MSAEICVIDYGVGNIGAVVNMIKRAGGTARPSADHATIGAAQKILLPGVGSFDTAVEKLKERGLFDLLREVASSGSTMLGICLGMQLLADGSEEGKLPGLGLIPGTVRRFRFDAEYQALKIPQMGWNKVRVCKQYPLVAGVNETSRYYFVHSFHYDCKDSSDVLLETTYGYPFASGVQRANVMGVQFHPEKSHRYGMQLLKNFMEI